MPGLDVPAGPLLVGIICSELGEDKALSGPKEYAIAFEVHNCSLYQEEVNEKVQIWKERATISATAAPSAAESLSG